MFCKKSILFVNGHLQVGGVEKALIDLLLRIDYDKYEVDLLLLEGGGVYLSQVPSNVRIIIRDNHQLEGPFLKSIWENMVHGRFKNVIYRTIQSLSKYTRERSLHYLKYLIPFRRHYDTAIAFRTEHSAQIVAYAVSSDRKYLWWHHGAVPEEQGQIDYLSRFFNNFNSIVAVSSGCMQMLLGTFDLSANRLVIIPNIIDPALIKKLANDYASPKKNSKFRIVTISRFSAEKHIEEAVKAAAMLKDEIDYEWYMIGDGPEYNMVKERVSELGLDGRVLLTGSLSNPYPYLKHADLMVHPSQIESLCISVLEAMAMRVPCVVVRSLGPESYIEDGYNGFLSHSGPDAICNNTLRALETDTGKLDIIKQKAFLTVESFYSPKVVMPQFERLIDERRD